MAIECQTGQFAKDSSGTDDVTQDVTVGFDPKALIIWGSKNRTSNNDGALTNCASIGVCDDADRNRCIAIQNEDNSGNVEARKESRSTAVLAFLSDSSAAEVSWASVTLETLKFVLTWELNDTIATLLHWIAYGGADITGVHVDNFNKSTNTSVPNTQNVGTAADTRNGVNNEAIVFLIGSQNPSFQNISNNMVFGIGAAASPSQEGFVQNSADDNTAVGEFYQTYRSANIWNKIAATSGNVDARAEFAGFTSLGFDLTWTVNDNVADKLIYLIIKGGKWEVLESASAKITTTGTKVFTTAFEPKGLFLFGTRRASGGTARADSSLNIGAAASTSTETNMVFSAEDLSDPMNVGVGSSQTHVHRVSDPTDPSTMLSEATLDSFNATDFTLDYTTVDSNAYRFAAIVCGDLGAAIVKVINEVENIDAVNEIVKLIGRIKQPEDGTAINLVEIITKSKLIVKLQNSILNLAEGIVKARAQIRLRNEDENLGEQVVKTKVIVKDPDTSIDIGEIISKSVGKVKIIADGAMNLIEGIVKTKLIAKAIDEIQNLIEGILKVRVQVRLINEIVNLVENITKTKVIVKIRNEIENLIENITKTLGMIKIINEVVNLLEGIIAVLGISKVIDEIVNIAENIVKSKVIVKIRNEIENLVEQILKVRAQVRLINENENILEVITKSRVMVRLIQEVENLVEGIIKATGLSKSISDGVLNIAETIVKFIPIIAGIPARIRRITTSRSGDKTATTKENAKSSTSREHDKGDESVD